MKIKCNYCGAYLLDTDEKCPNCGAVNDNHKRASGDAPKTIEELKQWYTDRNLPPAETTRFFIGINYEKPRAFGIYQDGREFIVYKNKDDGSRAIRYQGSDEAYAVNELYQKLRSEIANQKSRQGKKKGLDDKILIAIVLFSFLIFVAFAIIIIGPDIKSIRQHKESARHNGYYTYEENTYYRYYDDWYIYEDDDWSYSYDTPEAFVDNYEEYFKGSEYLDEFAATSFDDSEAYKDITTKESDSTWDSSDSWSSSDSWDSGSTDWGSDW